MAMKSLRSITMKKLSIITLLLLSLVFVPWSRGQSLAPSSGATDEVNFKLMGIDGKSYNTSDLRGNVLVVSFGATWCIACKEELAILEQLQAEYAAKPVKFFWVDIESSKEVSDKKLRAYMKERNVTIPALRDTDRSFYNQAVANVNTGMDEGSKTRVPLLVLIDQAGHITLPGQFGMTNGAKANIQRRLERLLAAQNLSSR